MFPLLEPWIWLLILLLTLSGVAFSYAKYRAGSKGLDEILKRYPRLDRDRLEQVSDLFNRYGNIDLLLAGFPGFDTVLSLAAGASGVTRSTFIIWVSIGKLIRWWLLALILVEGFTLLFGR